MPSFPPWWSGATASPLISWTVFPRFDLAGNGAWPELSRSRAERCARRCCEKRGAFSPVLFPGPFRKRGCPWPGARPAWGHLRTDHVAMGNHCQFAGPSGLSQTAKCGMGRRRSPRRMLVLPWQFLKNGSLSPVLPARAPGSSVNPRRKGHRPGQDVPGQPRRMPGPRPRLPGQIGGLSFGLGGPFCPPPVGVKGVAVCWERVCKALVSMW